MIKNDNNFPVVIQSWVDDGDLNGSPEKNTGEKIISINSILKVLPGDIDKIKLLLISDDFDNNKETLYWLNIYEIPSYKKNTKKTDNQLSVGIRLQVKVIYRPDNIKVSADHAIKDIIFYKNKGKVFVENRSPLFITFRAIVNSDNMNESYNINMLSPYEKKETSIPLHVRAVSYSIINDYGDEVKNDYKIK